MLCAGLGEAVFVVIVDTEKLRLVELTDVVISAREVGEVVSDGSEEMENTSDRGVVRVVIDDDILCAVGSGTTIEVGLLCDRGILVEVVIGDEVVEDSVLLVETDPGVGSGTKAELYDRTGTKATVDLSSGSGSGVGRSSAGKHSVIVVVEKGHGI